MAIDGLWGTEIFGLWGREHRGVLVLRDGRVVGGGNNHHSLGTYEVDGDTMSASLVIRYHGTPRTMFGSTEREFTLEIKDRREGEQVTGEIHRSDRPELKLPFRLTRRATPS